MDFVPTTQIQRPRPHAICATYMYVHDVLQGFTNEHLALEKKTPEENQAHVQCTCMHCRSTDHPFQPQNHGHRALLNTEKKT